MELQTESEQRVAEEYLSSLADLNCNSKPLINMLTMLAEENIEYAPVIVKVVEKHIAKVPPDFKLPILYLIDSIVKNVKSTYVQLFSECIVNIFCGVFEKVNEKVRERMYALRQTWNEVFSPQKLYALDVKVKCLDNNWPITAKQPSIHVNPNFFKTHPQAEMEKVLQDKRRELLELRKKKLELELEATKKHLEEQEKQISKATETVIPPPVVEALAATTALQANSAALSLQAQHSIPAHLIASGAIMTPGYMAQNAVAAITPVRPAIYHHNIRPGFRPNLHPNMLDNVQFQPIGPIHTVNTNKPKVHPVNPALLSTVRPRDPRLARQQLQQQQQQQQQQHQQQELQTTNTNNSQNNQRTADNSSIESKTDSRSSKSQRKSPTKSNISSNKSSSQMRSFARSKSSSRDKDRDRDHRKRGETTKSSSTSPSSSERKKSSSSSSRSDKYSSSKCDKDAFEIAPLSTAFKRKSASPSVSPHKSRDSKRSNSHNKSPASSSSSHSRSKTRSRSPSPLSNFHDVDLRKSAVSPDKRSKLTDMQQDYIKNNKKEEQQQQQAETKRQALLVNDNSSKETDKMFDIEDNLGKSALTKATSSSSSTTTSTHKVSFKITKTFNKLEKSTEHLLTACSLSANQPGNISSATSAGSGRGGNVNASNNRMEVDDTKIAMLSTEPKREEQRDDFALKKTEVVSMEQDDNDIKKRPSTESSIKDEEPLAKKSKPTKLDTLFGTEDVDLRQLIPPPPATLTAAVDEETAPPPPTMHMVSEIVQSRQRNENWDNIKTDSIKNSPKKSSFEDVRAKLAKTAKLSKFSKSDKQNKESNQRHKLAELHMNEDTQEANDEKIRAMITQAQELLEAGSINQDQYKNLVKTVMSINETNKLKEAKRRESLNSAKQKLNNEEAAGAATATDGIDVERNAAREAVLKKRIPKINKNQTAANDPTEKESQKRETLESTKSEDSPRYEEKTDSTEEHTSARSSRSKRGPKQSKWGDRIIEPPAMIGPVNIPPQRPWNMVGPHQNKRGAMAFRGAATMPPNIHNQWPPMSVQANFPSNTPPPPMAPMHSNLPPVIVPQAPIIPKPCNSIDNPQEDLVRTITIDGVAKEIRFYDQVAIVFMEVDQPREIGFQNGQRTIYLDSHEPIILKFNDDYRSMTLDGEILRLRFGFPSRELYIDEHWYEIYFGGPPIAVPIKNKMHMLKAEGPPPQVNIGSIRRDLVVGKINMIVDALNVIPLFLDARVQSFRLGDKDHTIQFADSLLTVLLDGSPNRVEYGGLPRSLYLGGKKYFVRFGALPQGIVAGKVQIKDMIYVETKAPPPPSPADLVSSAALSSSADKPTPTAAQATTTTTTTTTISEEINVNNQTIQDSSATTLPILPSAALSNINIDELFQKLVSTGILGGSSGILPAVNNSSAAPLPNAASAGNANAEEKSKSKDISLEENSNPSNVTAMPLLEAIKPIDLNKAESIKTRQSAIIAQLYTGMQCSSCGVRFPPEQTIKYSQHLDWHFRQNRRDRDTSRKAHARKWYYDLNDWVEYEEVEDIEEKEKNFFETQQNDPETMDETSNQQRSANSPIASCAAGPDDVDRACDMCQEKFEQFYNNELEEWHLRSAMRVDDDKLYHPLCYEDYKASLNPPAVKEAEVENDEEKDSEMSTIQIDDDNAVDIVIKSEEKDNENDDKSVHKIDDDEDDDVIVLPNEEPSVTEIEDDDDEYVPINVTREHMGTTEDENMGNLNETNESDVEIQEPHIPFTDLDTYVEKDLPEPDESSQMSFRNLKIKEEPKEDEDEDDGFEDVGTVLITADEISIHSSEDTQTQTIESSNTQMSPIAERPASATSQQAAAQQNEEHEDTLEHITDNISMDGNTETGNEHNLSAVGPAPAVPLASLVNKIKINISKNTVTTSSSNSTSSSLISTSSNSTNDSHKNIPAPSSSASAFNPIPTISTIPVLCGGGTTISSITSSLPLCSQAFDDDSNGSDSNLVSTISVLGNYGSGGSSISAISSLVRPVPISRKPATPPPPVEEAITYELKPELQRAVLNKKEKVVCGSETSGLCSIM